MSTAKLLLGRIGESHGNDDTAWRRLSTATIGEILTEARDDLRLPQGLAVRKHATSHITMYIRDTGELRSVSSPAGVLVEEVGGTILIGIAGHSDAVSVTNPNGRSIMLEIFDGRLQLVVWADANDEEPTHIIPLTVAANVKPDGRQDG